MIKFLIIYFLLIFVLPVSGKCQIANPKCIDGDCKNGLGTFIYSDSSIYIGYFENNKRNGKGKLYYKNGDTFKGNWLNDQRVGNGIMIYRKGKVYNEFSGLSEKTSPKPYFSDGAYYNGDWSDDKRNGIGKYFDSLGNHYEGNWINNLENGKAIFYDCKGNKIEGTWEDGILKGEISIFFDNKDTYLGSFKTGLNGKGIYKYRNGSKYQGNFENNKMHGTGEMKYFFGITYTGSWKENKIEGDGVVLINNKEKISSGRWKTVAFNDGDLKILNENNYLVMHNWIGDLYFGESVNGKPNGFGTYVYENGNTYKGNWLNGTYNGFGSLVYANGDKKEGNWISNKLIIEKPQKFDLSLKNYQYPYRIGKFKALVKDGDNIVTYANCPINPPSAMFRVGDFWFYSNTQSGISDNETFSDQNKYNNLSWLYKNNSQLKYRNNIYSCYYENGKLNLLEISFRNKLMYNREQVFKDYFEIKIDSGIETFDIRDYNAGSGLILFSAQSTFTSKHKLFVGNIENQELISINLNNLNKNFKDHSSGGFFQGNYLGEDVLSYWKPYGIFQFEKIITAFISIPISSNSKTYLMAIRINQTDKTQNLVSTNMNLGNVFEEGYYGKVNAGEIYFLSNSGGFVNVCNEGKFDWSFTSKINNTFKLTLYNKNLNEQNSTLLYDFTYISSVVEKNDFLIVGGFTTTKGYVGYPNPVITVLRKSDLTVVYTKFFAQKNAMVDLIKTYENSVYIAISGFFGNIDTKDDTPIIIMDVLNSSGKFENDLFHE